MRTIREMISVLLLLTVLLSACGPAAAAGQKSDSYQIDDKNNDTFVQLLGLLKNTCEVQAKGDEEKLSGLLEQGDVLVEQIASVNADDGDIARSITEHWKTVYLNPDYPLCVYGGGEKADGLVLNDSDGEKHVDDRKTVYSDPDDRHLYVRSKEAKEPVATQSDLDEQHDEKHAFIILGYKLNNGSMKPELIGRCDAAAAAARSFPDSYLICSGGATGPNNPQRHTEGEEMKKYLVGKCGIDSDRILTDTRARTTEGNAENTFVLLRENDIHSITIVTSTYHQKWGQAVYNTMAALYEKRYGFKVRIAGNYCFEIQPASENLRKGYEYAISQIAEMLQLKRAKKIKK